MCIDGDCLELPLSPCGCANCEDCVEPERIVVRRLNTFDKCEGLANVVREIATVQATTCIAKLISVSVNGSTVTLNTQINSSDQEYSQDGISFQDSNVFLNAPCGTRKYYVRQRSFPACIDAKRATISQFCDCESDMMPVSPPVVECIGGFLNVQYRDSCGNEEFRPSATACGQCTPNMQDVIPLVPRCGANHKKEYLQVDGCGGVNWRATEEPCGVCVNPVVPAGAEVTKATCNQQGQILSNGSFTFGPIAGGDKFGLSLGAGYNGPDYDTAQVVPSNNIISVSGLPGQSYPTGYTLRIFNGSNDCYVDKAINFPAVNCAQACIYPTGKLFKVDPTCNGAGGATNNNGILILSDLGNATKYQICEGSTFTCTPDYANAGIVPGSQQFNIRTNVGFSQNQQFRDFMVRLYNGSEACYSDLYLRFTNPCYTNNNCVMPSNSAAVITAATCTGTNLNNNAQIAINGIQNANRFGFSMGTTYSGDSYADADLIPGNSIILAALAGLQNESKYIVRLYNGSDQCYKDIPVTVPGVSCAGTCVQPTANAGTGTAATCNGTTPNSDASIVISSIANATKFGRSSGNTYTGPAYDSATQYFGGDIQFLNLAGSNSSQTFTVRIFNGNNGCYVDRTIVIPASNCATNCVLPTKTGQSGIAATCNGSTPNNDASITITGITNMTKYGVSNGNTYNGPAFASAIAATGATLNITGLSGSTSVQTKTVRIFNGSNTCYLDVTVNIGASSCAPSCVNPTFTLTSVPETCTDGVSNANGKLRINNITNGTKYQVCLYNDVFDCTPNYANSPVISGSGPIDVYSAINTTGETSIKATVRVYNGSETCFTDHAVTITNPCTSCCNMSITGVTLNNV